MDFLVHSWGNSPTQKKREKEYNAEYYKKNKDRIAMARHKKEDLLDLQRLYEYNAQSYSSEADRHKLGGTGKSYRIPISQLHGVQSNYDLMQQALRDRALLPIRASKERALLLISAGYNYVQMVNQALLYKDSLRKASINQHAADELARITSDGKNSPSRIESYKNAANKRKSVNTPEFIPLTNKAKVQHLITQGLEYITSLFTRG